MMKRLRIPILLVVYFSLATLLPELTALAVVWNKNQVDRKTFVQLLAVLYDIDLATMYEKIQDATQPIKEAQVSYQEVLEARQLASLDLKLREMATDKGIRDIRQLRAVLSAQKDEYKDLKDRFDRRMERLRQGAADQSIREVQRELESISPRQAKEQLLLILDNESIDPETSLHFVVTILKGMPLEKRKKILTEFKRPEDQERLHEILRQIRLGVPDVELMHETRKKLEQFQSRD